MGLLDSIKDKAASGLSWGRSAAAKGWSAAKEFGAVAKAEASQLWQQAKTKATQTFTVARQVVRDNIAEATSNAAGKAAAAAVSDPKRLEEMRRKLDKRDRYTGAVEDCPGESPTTHPDKNDGRFLGALTCAPGNDVCEQTSAKPPADGVKPSGCMGKGNGKPFPKVTFTNGINNTRQQVCDTMQALADSRCVEVIGIYNATYADPSLEKPVRQAADYMDAAKAAAKGAVKGAATGAATGGSPLSALAGVLRGAAVGAAPEVALQEAGRVGLTQDVLDCLDTITRQGNDAASQTLANEITAALNRTPPQMIIYAHSQGGLNASEALAQARTTLVEQEIERLVATDMPPDVAGQYATIIVERRMANVDVHLFGTLERGLPDGPVYHRHTNEYDPVPKVIRAAQGQLTPDLVRDDPKGAPQVETFKVAPSMNPMAAHGMLESYIPHLDQLAPKSPCCPGHRKMPALTNAKATTP